MDVDMDDATVEGEYHQSAVTGFSTMPPPPSVNVGASYLVVDTNVLISHLELVNQLVDLAPRANITIIIPVAVVNELDGLKSGSRKQSTKISAQKAITWYFELFAANCPYIRGQKPQEVIDEFTRNDDAILDCCLYIKKHHPNDLVVLMSNDKNLCAKALIEPVPTVTVVPEMTAISIAEMIYNERQSMGPEEPQVRDIEMTDTLMAPLFNSAPVTDDIPSVVHQELEQVAIELVDQAIIKCYGSRELTPEYTRPSTLEEAAELLIRFWFTVFEEIFEKVHSRKFDPFKAKGKNNRGEIINTEIPSPAELPNFVNFWKKLLVPIHDDNMGKYRNSVVKDYFKRWTKMADENINEGTI
ncbi:hypothetical protein DIURU_001169 [Diutina rugosa]|uniref:PIN domain-containing protein n=1 Tax=Diutina rugosa TaxID=5481 RepID=A0A642UVD4_DIURU|nr:uncharacterized protein DIURU_001169 [Diutina rugosa]KAA8906227.1 hypothetical protein DIURU_001169 [Diutina rugosa]